jgi:hypothetical protein
MILGDVGDGLISRWLSSFVAAAYIVAAFAWGRAGDGFRTAAYCLLAWSCVWFPEAMGMPTGRLGRNSRETPPGLVWFIGWGLLLIPAGVLFLLWAQGV